MASILLGARILLSLVFATAGVSKLFDLSGSRRALGDFGVPAGAVGIAAIALPLAELATAAALLPARSAQWGGLAALLLLLVFIGGIANALRKGQAPDCHCFGQLHSAPAGRGTLVRNVVLALVAAIVVLGGPGPSVADWASGRTATELAAIGFAVAATVLAAVCIALWFTNRTLRRDLAAAQAEVDALPPGLPVGADAPGFALLDVDGELRTLDALRARGLPVALVFMTPDCAGCQVLLPDLGRWQRSLSDRLTIAVLSIGGVEENRPKFAEHDIGDVILQEGAEMMHDYRVRATPSAVVVTPDGRIASAPAEGAPTIETLVRLTLRRGEAAAAAAA